MESLKAYLQGQIISYSAHIRKLRISTIQKLSSDLESVDQQLATAPSDDLSKRHVALQTRWVSGQIFFKAFHAKLIPLLHSVHVKSLSLGSLPPKLRQASISVLLKKDKDPDLCTSYRPISLMNVDTKILVKALACRLEKVLPTIISEEQTGFIKGHQLYYKVRTMLNVIYLKETTVTPEVVILIDAEKAFNRVEWNYLFAVSAKFGFGQSFISWIRLLHTLPIALVYLFEDLPHF